MTRDEFLDRNHIARRVTAQDAFEDEEREHFDLQSLELHGQPRELHDEFLWREDFVLRVFDDGRCIIAAVQRWAVIVAEAPR